MAEKVLNSRIVLKHDIEENWLKATGFIPKQGEIVIYDIDDSYTYERFKIGDGVTQVTALPFVSDTVLDNLNLKNGSEEGSLRSVGSAEEEEDYHIGEFATALGYGTKASGDYQHVEGKYNIADTNNTYAHITGNGENAENRANIYTLDWDGNAWFKGDIYTGGMSAADSDAEKFVKQSTLESYVSEHTEAAGTAAATLNEAKTYTDEQIANLINGAPTTLDTLGEIATAMEENADVVEALNSAIGIKANAADLTNHINDHNNPHAVTLEQLEVTATATELNALMGINTNVQRQLDVTVPNTRTINNKPLNNNITLLASDIGADEAGASQQALADSKTYTNEKIEEVKTNATDFIEAITEEEIDEICGIESDLV